FEAWLAEPGNAEAWDEVQEGWARVGEEAQSPELLALRRDALSRVHAHNRARWLGSDRLRWAAALVALLMGAALIAGLLQWRTARPDVYETALGERRGITLVDGSRISLDAASRLTVRYTEALRRLELERGQARFDVARDAARPFVVGARGRSVVATGT